MANNPPGVMIYHSYLDQLMMLSPAEVGNLLVALLQYAKGGEEEITVELTSEAEIAFSFMRSRIDVDFEKYRSRCKGFEGSTHKTSPGTAVSGIAAEASGRLEDFIKL